MDGTIPRITESEFEVMKAIWDFGRPMTFTEVRERVQAKTGWGQSTIKTLLQRLHAKGALSQHKRDVYYYAPLVSEEAYNEHATQSLIDKLYDGSAKNLLAALVSGNRLTQADIDALLALLDGGGEDE